MSDAGSKHYKEVSDSRVRSRMPADPFLQKLKNNVDDLTIP